MNNPSAFPSAGYGASGMTLRDYFAGQALAGMLPARDESGRVAYVELTPDEIAKSAYKIADAMLAERGESK